MNHYNMDVSDRILSAASSLFERLGIRSVSMDDISRQLGMSKKTIYQYFKDKDDIVTNYCCWHRKTHTEKLKSIAEDSPSALHELLALTEYMRESLSKMNPGLLHDLHKYHPTGYSVIQDHKSLDVMPGIIKSIQRGIDEGYYRSDINVLVLAKLRLEEVEMAFNPLVFPPSKFVMAEVQQQLMEHFFRGLLTLEGTKAFEALRLAQPNKPHPPSFFRQ